MPSLIPRALLIENILTGNLLFQLLILATVTKVSQCHYILKLLKKGLWEDAQIIMIFLNLILAVAFYFQMVMEKNRKFYSESLQMINRNLVTLG